MTWQKHLPFKMCFIVWRALRDKIPTDARISQMNIANPSRCICCKNPDTENVNHLFNAGDYAFQLWKHIGGPFGINVEQSFYRQILINWWKIKAPNPVINILVKCIPIATSWEIWRTRCAAKYGNEPINFNNSVCLISFSVLQVIKNQFNNFQGNHSWNKVIYLNSCNINFKKTFTVSWLKPPVNFVKLNSDGSCKEGRCGGGGVIRNHQGHLVHAYTVKAGAGTNNLAEALALLHGIRWCIAVEHK
ncbi:uncharacterized protein LOC132030043 [Lycium ferocissimum]|uniref:uncharacterized protein LOC132030043 n=1 Tax=Lycium ferocissimum TaxID=112874 RepID=UPI002815FD56|nr:uncharacterized protein LOC132030043 [Lycium ferocissimum]